MADSPHSNPQPEPPEGASQWKKLGILGAMGFEFVGFVVGGALVGRWVDERFDSSPWGVLSLILLGMFAAFWHIYRVIHLHLK